MDLDLAEYSCCFFGHRNIVVSEELINRLKLMIEKLIIENNVYIFFFGCNSKFDDVCYKIITELKEKYSHIKRIYMRAKYPNINKNYKKYILQQYEETYYPERLIKAGRAVYIERNYEMINNSKYCIIYYDNEYLPDKNVLYSSAKSGTKIAFDYAKKRGLHIENVY